MFEWIIKGPWPFWLSGLVIGVQIPLMYYVFNAGPGTSSAYGNVVKLLAPKSKLSWFQSARFQERFNGNFFFVLGIVLGGFLSHRLAGAPLFQWDMGLFSTATGLPFLAQGLWLFLGGAIMLFGARVADGCTSGNAIHGLSTLQVSGLVATIGFMLMGFIVTHLMFLSLMGGA